jgi:hypothetical protein
MGDETNRIHYRARIRQRFRKLLPKFETRQGIGRGSLCESMTEEYRLEVDLLSRLIRERTR